jgi:purine catabolism regulator
MAAAQEQDGGVGPLPNRGRDTLPHPGTAEAGTPAPDLSEPLLGRADALHRHLLETVIAGGALGDLCEGIAQHLETAVFATTTDGRVLARCEDGTEVGAAEAYGCFDRTGRFLVEREPLGPRNAEGAAIARAGEQDLTWCRRLVVGISAGTHDLGRLVAVSRSRDLGSADLYLLERAARIAALALIKDREVATVETKYRAEFLRDVLVGRAGDQESVVIHANALGWDLSSPVAVVVAEIDTDEEKLGLDQAQVEAVHRRFASAWTRVVRLREPRAPCVGFGNREVVALLPVALGPARESEDAATMRLVRDVVKSVRGAGGGGRRSFSTGVSRLAASVDEIPRAYEDAWSAVSIGRRIHGDDALHQFDDLGVFRLLALVPESADLERFVGETLGDLATDTSQEGADLRLTLGALLDTDLNIAETARQLHYHYNTVRYRVAKLERAVGPFTVDPELRLSLRLALKIVAMRGR